LREPDRCAPMNQSAVRISGRETRREFQALDLRAAAI
jgi:hypothetical protein